MDSLALLVYRSMAEVDTIVIDCDEMCKGRQHIKHRYAFAYLVQDRGVDTYGVDEIFDNLVTLCLSDRVSRYYQVGTLYSIEHIHCGNLQSVVVSR